jgi:hypothetical protein
LTTNKKATQNLLNITTNELNQTQMSSAKKKEMMNLKKEIK